MDKFVNNNFLINIYRSLFLNPIFSQNRIFRHDEIQEIRFLGKSDLSLQQEIRFWENFLLIFEKKKLFFGSPLMNAIV